LIDTLQATAPEVLLVLLASVMYLAGTFAKGPCRCWFWSSIAALGLASAVFATWTVGAAPVASAAAVVDGLAVWGKVLALVTGLGLILLSDAMSLDDRAPEYFASLLLVVAGSMFVAGANEVVLLFLGLELVSVPSYVLLYLARRDAAGQESAAKYFFLSIFASALFLYGLSFLYGAAGTTNVSALAQLENRLAYPISPSLLVALVLVVAGLCFKVAAFPLHFYAPDVYQGATHTLAALLAWMPKAAGFLVLVRVVTLAMPYLADRVAWLMLVLAAATMTVGNVLGLLQNNLRRLFAYSSIAHAGYMLVGVGVGAAGGSRYITTSGAESVVFYLVAYAAMTLGAFAVLVAVHSPQRPVESVDDLAGLAKSHPRLALAMALFLFSLTGIPITAGFWAKLAVFSSALVSGQDHYITLAIIGMVNAAISSYYYLRVIGVMYMHEPYGAVESVGSRPVLCVVAACTVVTLAIGFAPGPVLGWAAGLSLAR
jgi:NADH-quinone oxidoreductase subunit N